MLQPDAVARLRLLVDTARVPIAADTSRVQKISGIAPGENATGRVARELPNNTFHVIVRGKTFEMKLPAGFKKDFNVELRYVGDQPRPTFLLLTAPPGASAGKLSQLGQLIAALLAPQSESATGTTAQRALPVITGDPENTEKTPAFLRNALTQSGLFYESHQAQWVAGKLALEQLRKEPQALLRQVTQQIASPNPSHPNTSHTSATNQEAKPLPTNSLSPSAGERVTVTDLRSSDIHADTFPIVRQQLESLDTRQVVWQGEAWPDQWMEWETGQDNAAAGDEQQAAWYSTIKLELPSLGTVHIRTVLAGSTARISIESAESKSATRLRDAQAVLADNLESRGIGLAEFKVASAESNV